MAVLEFNWDGYEYQTGLKTLRRSYENASEALQADVDDAYYQISSYEERYPDDNNPAIELDEDGVIVHDPRDSLIYASLVAEQSIQAFRKAFAIMLYHHWERGARAWGDKIHGSFEKVVKAAQDSGVHIDPEIVHLLILVNSLKHNASIWGQPLYDIRPEWFPNKFRRDRDSIEWFDEIQLSSSVMDYLFEVVERSGPSY